MLPGTGAVAQSSVQASQQLVGHLADCKCPTNFQKSKLKTLYTDLSGKHTERTGLGEEMRKGADLTSQGADPTADLSLGTKES